MLYRGILAAIFEHGYFLIGEVIVPIASVDLQYRVLKKAFYTVAVSL